MTDEIRTFRDVKRIMEEPMKYNVEFKTPTGETKIAEYWVDNPGAAFAQCLIDNPDCTLLHATGGIKQGEYAGRIDYEPPPVQRGIVKQPRRYRRSKRHERDGIMPFYDEALSEKPWD